MSQLPVRLRTTAVTNDSDAKKPIIAAMKKCLSFLAISLSAITIFAADDPIVMTVAGYDVSLSEFRHYLDGNSSVKSEKELSVNDFAKIYVNYKMKVQAAVDAGIDTTRSFIDEFNAYRSFEIEQFNKDNDFLENTAKRSYEESVKEVGEAGLMNYGSISFEPANKSEEEAWRCKNLADSIYQALLDGADFSSLVARYSTDKYAEKGGDMGWYSVSMIPEGIVPFIYDLEVGEVTEPFVDINRVCILKYLNHRDLGTYEENRQSLYEWMYSRPALIREAGLRMADKYSDGSNWGMSDPDSIISYMCDNMESVCPEFGNISREYHDGLLLFEISNREVWNKAQSDPADLTDYLKSNSKLFKFDAPCFKGMVFFCKTEEVFNEIEQALKDRPFEEWSDIVLSFNTEGVKVRAQRGKNENGIFMKGDNAYVDSLIFGEGSFEPKNGYPYTHVLGHVIDRPEVVNDDQIRITESYQKHLENEWIKALHKKYKYKINKKVLKQVSLD